MLQIKRNGGTHCKETTAHPIGKQWRYIYETKCFGTVEN